MDRSPRVAAGGLDAVKEDTIMRLTTLGTFAILAAGAIPALAQSDTYVEIRPIAGFAVPTGAHRNGFDAAAFAGAQGSVRLTANLDLVASFAWQPTNAKYAVADRHANVLVYSTGLERVYRSANPANGGFMMFAGGGVGGRAFDFRSNALTSTACYQGYGNAGIGYERPRTTLRLELRDHLFCFKQPLPPFDRETRNEASLALGFGVRF